MAIEFNSFTNNIFNSIYSIPLLNGIFSSILYTSIILTIILIIILLAIYPCEKDTPPWILLRIFLYLVVANTLVFSVHHSIISNKYEEKYSNDESGKFITNINRKGGNSIYNKESIEVKPNFAEYEISDEVEQPQDNPKLTISDILDSVENTAFA